MAASEPEPVEGETLVPELAAPVVSVIVKVSVDAAGSESKTCTPDIAVVPLAFSAMDRLLVEMRPVLDGSRSRRYHRCHRFPR
jgi:hypothetical protein